MYALSYLSVINILFVVENKGISKKQPIIPPIDSK